MIKKITTSELRQHLGDLDLVLVDGRPMAAYNGWRLQGEARGGHIPGAIAFPFSWLDEIAPDELGQQLTSKGILPDKTIVIVDYSAKQAAAAAKKLNSIGYDDVSIYQPGFAEWSADETLPLKGLLHFEKLVHPAWLRALIDGRNPEHYDGNPFAIFHVNFGVPEEYALAHIPSAMHLDTNTLESESDWNRRSPAELESALLSYGITHDTTVILYGRDQAPGAEKLRPGQKAGQIAAARAAAILMYAGVSDVRLLDGGYDAWVNAGYEVETKENKPQPVSAFGRPIPAHPEYFVDIDEAKVLLSDHNGLLVSIRTWAEYTGDISGYSYIGPRGRISGAVWGNCGTDAYHMQHYRNIDNTMRDYHEIAANWQQGGITPDQRVAFFCGTGWRASETFFYAQLMGWPQVAIYDGGWFEWSSDPANPIEVGEPKN